MTTATLLLSLLVMGAIVQRSAATLCSATRPPGNSKSNSASQQAKECDVDTICACQFASSTSSSAPASSTSSAAASSSSSSSAAPSSSSSSDSTTAAASSSSSSSSAAYANSTVASTASTGYTASMANEPCPCILMQELLNMRYLYLSSSQQVIFDGCLDEIRVILVDVSITIQVKVSKIALAIKNHFKKHPDIKKALKFKKIAGWGRVYELCAAGVSFDSANSDSMIAIDSTGECNLTMSLANATANDVCGSGSSVAISAVLARAKKVFKKQTPGYDKGRKLGWFKKAIVKYLFVQNPSIEACVRNVSIPGFGKFDQFLSLCDQYETSSSMNGSLLNGTADSCVLIQSLNSSLNSNATVNSTDSATLQEAFYYVSNLTVYFNQVTDIVLRLKFVSAQFSMLSSQCRVLVNSQDIMGSVLSIDFSDVVVSSHFCSNDGCGNITYGGASMTYPEECQLDTVYNISDVEEACQTWNDNVLPTIYNTTISLTSARNSFKTYFNAIRNCVRGTTYNNAPLTDLNSRYSCAVYYVTNYAANQPSLHAKWLSVELYSVLVETSTTVTFSNLGGFCGCS